MATVRPAPSTLEDFRCPSCGRPGGSGDCSDPKACAAAIADAEREPLRSSVHVWDRADANLDRLWQAGMEALDMLGIGLVVCDSSALLVASNRTAEEILLTGDGLLVTAEGELSATAASAPSLKELSQRAAEALGGGNTEKQNVAIAIPRRSGQRALTVYLRAIETTAQGGSSDAVVLVMIVDSALPVKTSEAELHQLYGFTATEARMANLLMEGKTLEECCDELAVQRSTGCSHVKRIFKKTGVHRQSELVSLLLKSIGLLRVHRETRSATVALLDAMQPALAVRNGAPATSKV